MSGTIVTGAINVMVDDSPEFDVHAQVHDGDLAICIHVSEDMTVGLLLPVSAISAIVGLDDLIPDVPAKDRLN